MCVCVCVYAHVTKSYPTLCDPTDCCPPGSSVPFSRQEYWSGWLFPPPHCSGPDEKQICEWAWGGGGQAEGLGGAGRVGRMKPAFCCQFDRAHPPPGGQVTQDRADQGWAPSSSVPASPSQSTACPVHFGGLCYNEEEEGAL